MLMSIVTLPLQLSMYLRTVGHELGSFPGWCLLSTVTPGLQSIHTLVRCAYHHSVFSFDSLYFLQVPRTGSRRMFVQELPAFFQLLLIQLAHELDVQFGFTPSSLLILPPTREML